MRAYNNHVNNSALVAFTQLILLEKQIFIILVTLV